MNWFLALSLILMLSLGFSSLAQEIPNQGIVKPGQTNATHPRVNEGNCYHCIANVLDDRNGLGFNHDMRATQKRAYDAVPGSRSNLGEGSEGVN